METTTEYCQMNPASIANLNKQETSKEHKNGSDHCEEIEMDENHYMNPRKPQKGDTVYARLRQSRIHENNYTLIRKKKESKKSSEAKRAMCCIIVFLTVTFVITSSLLAYTIWMVSDLSEDYIINDKDIRSELSGNADHFNDSITALMDSIEELQSELRDLRTEIFHNCRAIQCVRNCLSSTPSTCYVSHIHISKTSVNTEQVSSSEFVLYREVSFIWRSNSIGTGVWQVLEISFNREGPLEEARWKSLRSSSAR